MAKGMNSALKNLEESGYTVIPGAFDHRAIDQMRLSVLRNLQIMSNTRPTPTSFHIAGFHRFPSLEAIHTSLSTNSKILRVLDGVYEKRRMICLGLTDITVNRSQPWHTDLLRGAYSVHLTQEICWDTEALPCLKALLYLQDGASLQLVPGSHRHPIDLSADERVIPTGNASVVDVSVHSGDVILMDIRTIHRGASEAEMAEKGLGSDAKILISTVFGDRYSKLTQAMQVGNSKRLIDWDIRTRGTRFGTSSKLAQ